MSKRLNVKIDSCYDCPHNESDGWCNNLLRIVEKNIPNDCPLPDDEPIKYNWKNEEEKEAFIEAWREAMGHEGEE
jgi:hypothetical protein